jgi:iron complex transport system substrate-binding protein
MSVGIRTLGLAMTLLFSIAPALAAEERIVTLGACVTEMVYALGEGDAIVAVDSSSTFPVAARRLPQVGYYRMLGAEGILALRPTLVLGTTQAGPPETIQKLRRAGVNLHLFEAPTSLDSALATLQAIADERERSAQGAEIVADIRRRIDAVRTRSDGTAPRVLALIAGGGSLMVAGRGNAADLMIGLAGGINAAGALEGYKPLSTEAVTGLEPDVILIPDHALPLLGGLDAVLELPGLAQTAAARKRHVVVMESQLLLGLGPRLGVAVEELAAALRTAPTRLSRAL